MCRKEFKGLIIGEENFIILSINFTLFKLETKNSNVRSTTKTVLRISKNCLEPDAFSDKQFCENYWALTFLLYGLE